MDSDELASPDASSFGSTMVSRESIRVSLK